MQPLPRLHLAEFSHIGHRSENQDSHAVLHDPGGAACLLVVADGMGGHAGGALAAQTAIACATAEWTAWREAPQGAPQEAAEAFLSRLLGASHEAVRAAGMEAGLGLEPGATFAALLLARDGAGALQCLSIHAGDARIIQYGPAGLVKHSIDHSMAQLHVMRGHITQEEAATHPDQRWVLSHVGGDEAPAAEVTRWDLAEGSQFVVCSDGFWEVFTHSDAQRLFQEGQDSAALRAALEAMFRQKLPSLQHQDNTTAILLRLAD